MRHFRDDADGSGFPTDMGELSRFTESPLKATWVPGCNEAQSKGILGRLVAQPKIITISRLTRKIRHFFETIFTPPSDPSGIQGAMCSSFFKDISRPNAITP
jgi:hypothetical protein